MGVDAEILVRKVPVEMVTDEWLKEISWRLVEAIGAESFFLSDGLPPEQYEVAYKAWSDAFDAHPRYPDLQKAREGVVGSLPNSQAIYNGIYNDIGPRPEEMRTAIRRSRSYEYDDEDNEVRKPPGSSYSQDGDPIYAEPGECLLELSLMGRYYGPGYERGDILKYCAIAEWLELNIPGCEVWYGGDSSGICAELFDEAKRKEFRNHLYSENGRDYFRYDYWRDDSGKQPVPCGLCPGGIYRGSRYGSGRDGLYSAYSCAGCGKAVETNDGGKTWTKAKEW